MLDVHVKSIHIILFYSVQIIIQGRKLNTNIYNPRSNKSNQNWWLPENPKRTLFNHKLLKTVEKVLKTTNSF